MVDLNSDFQLLLLEEGFITYVQYCNTVNQHDIPREYLTYSLFLKNKGKASKRLIKELQWKNEARRKNISE